MCAKIGPTPLKRTCAWIGLSLDTARRKPRLGDRLRARLPGLVRDTPSSLNTDECGPCVCSMGQKHVCVQTRRCAGVRGKGPLSSSRALNAEKQQCHTRCHTKEKTEYRAFLRTFYSRHLICAVQVCARNLHSMYMLLSSNTQLGIQRVLAPMCGRP